MKRFISLLLSLIFILSLTSCAGIGDGAMYENAIEDQKTVFESQCRISHYNIDESTTHCFVRMGEEAVDIEGMFCGILYDIENTDEQLGDKTNFKMTFSDRDDGVERCYRISSDDYVWYGEGNEISDTDMHCIGRSEGLYGKLTNMFKLNLG